MAVGMAVYDRVAEATARKPSIATWSDALDKLRLHSC